VKLYDSPGPNPKKVRVYLAEKGLAIPSEVVDLTRGANRSADFLAKNPMGRLPVLELDDGTYLPESLAIMEYLEELHPDPVMIGTSPVERARVRALERLCELGVLIRISTIFLNVHPFATKGAMAGRLEQSPQAAAYARWYLESALAVLDVEMSGRQFVAGPRPTIADCTLVAALEFAEIAEIELPHACPHVRRWYAGFRQRPSADA
jgi:glutathione S-transferase